MATACRVKEETGVKCFDCPERLDCKYLHPPNRKPICETIRQADEPIEYYPYYPMDKQNYTLLLLVAEDFFLTNPEKKELFFYASNFETLTPSGGRALSKRRLYACMCIFILDRDGRKVIYEKNKDYYAEKYNLKWESTKKIMDYVKKETEKVLKIVGI